MVLAMASVILLLSLSILIGHVTWEAGSGHQETLGKPPSKLQRTVAGWNYKYAGAGLSHPVAIMRLLVLMPVTLLPGDIHSHFSWESVVSD